MQPHRLSIGDTYVQPEPTVIGASDADCGELQSLTALPEAWSHPCSVDELIKAVFDHFTNLAALEEQNACARQSDTIVKQNRRNTYLDIKKRRLWEAQSQKFLKRRADVAKALSVNALYSVVAMQHLLALDAKDICVGVEQRCFDDRCTKGVNDQFLLDASRGRYCVDGSVFHYAESHEEETEEAFVQRLVDAVRTLVPPELLTSVTSVMSQSGLAALERAGLCSVAVSGGKQDVDYMLAPNSDGLEGVIVKLQVSRKGFKAYMRDEDSEEPSSCDSTSSIRKAATLTFGVDGVVDVVDLVEEIKVLRDGELLPSESLCRVIVFEKSTHESILNRAWRATARRCMQRAARCTDRCRGARRWAQ